jgi:anti-sigma factor RsiW
MTMKCERAVELLTQSADSENAVERRMAAEHAATCSACRSAVEAVQYLRAEGLSPVPRLRAEAFAQAMAVATKDRAARTARVPTFLSGLALGAALAAGIAIAIVTLMPGLDSTRDSATPQVTLAASEHRDITISVASTQALEDAEIHVVLSGPVELFGYEGQRELRWRTNLDRGANQLTLPVLANGMGRGQVLVEVVHGDKRRTFVVDIESLG